MIPETTGALVAFFLLVAPGVTFSILASRYRPHGEDSAFREASIIVLASAVLSGVALTLLALVRARWPSLMPDAGAWLRDGGDYVKLRHRLIARTALIELGSASALAGIASYTYWRLLRHRRPTLTGDSGWLSVFRERKPENTHCFIAVELDDGSLYEGMLFGYMGDDVPTDQRELIIRQPIYVTRRGRDRSLLDQAWHRVVLPGSNITRVYVSYQACATAPRPNWLERRLTALGDLLRGRDKTSAGANAPSNGP